jgi:hypothetical protein
MTRWVVLSAVLLSLLSGCGDPGLLQVLGVWPVAGYNLAGTNSSSGDFSSVVLETVDTHQNACRSSDGKTCTVEPFAAHFAVVQVVNRYTADASNPQFGVVTLEGYSLKLVAQDPDAPEFRTQSGAVNHVLGPGMVESLVLPLVDIAMKADYASRAPTTFARYSATYTLVVTGHASLKAATTIELGPINACPKDTMPVDSFDCPDQ